MNYSKERLITLGKAKIDSAFGPQADKEKAKDGFSRKISRLFGQGKAFLVGSSPTKCLICGKPLVRADMQLTKYCSKECRKRRHNANR